jgi:leucyl-tRNA synthetase
MKKQFELLDLDLNWENVKIYFFKKKEVNTSSKEYYKWTQWIFLQLHKEGLAYQEEEYVNWDPVDKTVLANEQSFFLLIKKKKKLILKVKVGDQVQ